ncbi:MAG: nucleotide disphospho-sugar-binding domain-containing protein [Planctomycetota bacterium]
MGCFGFFVLPGHGHIPPSLELARLLRARGHEVVYYTTDHFRPQLEEEGMRVVTVSLAPGRGRSRFLGRYGRILDSFGRLIDTTVAELPDQVLEDGVQALLVDQSVVSGRTIAEIAGVPFVTFIPGLPLRRDRSGRLAPLFAPWEPSTGRLARMRNRAAFGLFDLATVPFVRRLNRCRRRAGLPPHARLDDTFSDDVVLTQFPAELEPDGVRNDRPFHLVGPLVDLEAAERRELPAASAFPWERIDERRPLLYISYGTVAPATEPLYHAALDGSEGLGFMRVVTMGGRPIPPSLADRVDEHTLIVPFAPQLALLKRAAAVVSHGGLNSTLESLLLGVPILAVPICDDQLGISGRLSWAGAGLALRASKLSPEPMRRALTRLRDEPEFRDTARRLARDIQRGGGAPRAADLIERLLPVRREAPAHPVGASPGPGSP